MGWVSQGGMRYRALFGANKFNDDEVVEVEVVHRD